MKGKKNEHDWQWIEPLGTDWAYCPLCGKTYYIPTGERMTLKQAFEKAGYEYPSGKQKQETKTQGE